MTRHIQMSEEVYRYLEEVCDGREYHGRPMTPIDALKIGILVMHHLDQQARAGKSIYVGTGEHVEETIELYNDNQTGLGLLVRDDDGVE